MKRRRSRRRSGFSLVEIVVAMGILTICLMGLARVTFNMSKRARDNSLLAKRTYAIIRESNKFGAMNYTTLGTFSLASKVDTIGDFIYTRTLTRTISGNLTTLVIKITPSADVTRVDSVFVYRTKPAVSPLCTTCC